MKLKIYWNDRDKEMTMKLRMRKLLPTSSSSSWLARRTTGPPRQCHRLTCFLIYLIWQIFQQILSSAVSKPKQCISDLTTRPTSHPCLHLGSSHNEASRILNVYCGFLPPRTLQVLCFGLNLVLYVVEEVSPKYILQRRRRSLKKPCNYKYFSNSFLFLKL